MTPETQAQAREALVAYAEGRLSHVNRGSCPDAIEGAASRDPTCKVCRALTELAIDSHPDAPAGGESVAWLIEYEEPEAHYTAHGEPRVFPAHKRRHVFLHNAIGDYRDMHPDATSTPLVPATAHAELVAEVGRLRAEHEAMKGLVHDEIAANLAFREAGGALADEDMPTFCARLLREKAEAESRAQAAEGDAGRWRWLRNAPDGLLCVRADRHKGLHNVRLTGDELDAAIDTARATQPEGESHE